MPSVAYYSAIVTVQSTLGRLYWPTLQFSLKCTEREMEMHTPIYHRIGPLSEPLNGRGNDRRPLNRGEHEFYIPDFGFRAKKIEPLAVSVIDLGSYL